MVGPNFIEMLIKIRTFFIKENAFENIVCEMAAILSTGRSVNISYVWNGYCNTNKKIW